MTTRPRVLHVSVSDGGGGADIAAYRIFQATRLSDVDAQMVVRRKENPASDAQAIPLRRRSRWIANLLANVASRVQKSGNPFHRSLNLIPTGGLRALEEDFDMVHLHWVGSNALSLKEIQSIGVPIVWTLHDSWPFSGAEHHPLYPDDRRFQTGYSSTNRYLSSRVDVDRFIWKVKRRTWTREFTLVAPSAWMKTQAQSSAIMGNLPTHIIPNPVPTDVFTADGPNLRSHLGISPGVRVLLFAGVGGTRFEHKGWSRFSRALADIAASAGPLHVLLVGQEQRPADLPLEVGFDGLGHISDEASMASVYRSCDLLVTTSTIESFGLTAAEASACGVPVVCSGTTGLADVVIAGETGWCFDPENDDSLSSALYAAIQDRAELLRRGLAGRKRARLLWSMETIGAQYAHVYRAALGMA